MLVSEVITKEFLLNLNPNQPDQIIRVRRISSNPELKGYGPKWQYFKQKMWVDAQSFNLEPLFVEWEKNKTSSKLTGAKPIPTKKNVTPTPN